MWHMQLDDNNKLSKITHVFFARNQKLFQIYSQINSTLKAHLFYVLISFMHRISGEKYA